METKLHSIEKPNFLHRLGYLYSKFKFGKVLSPQKVIYTRLPFAFTLFSARISCLDKKVKLSKELSMIIRCRVAQINICSFCLDIGKFMAVNEKIYSEKFYKLESFRTNPIFSAVEKAALVFTEELTIEKKISTETFETIKKHFSEREIVEIAWLISTEHYYNLMNLAFDLHSDNLCKIKDPQETVTTKNAI